VANRLRKIRRAPPERIPPIPARAHATPPSNASFETKHRPPAVFQELLSFTQRRLLKASLREQNRARTLLLLFSRRWHLFSAKGAVLS